MKDPRLKGKRCVVLARCSSAEQIGTSISDQVSACTAFLDQQEMILADVKLLEGQSGSVPKHIDDAIASIIKRKIGGEAIDVVLVYDLSRLSRAGARHSATVAYDLQQCGIELISAMGYTPRSDFSELKDSFESFAAHQHAKSIASAVSRGSQTALEQNRKAHCAAPPFGIDRLIMSASGEPLCVLRNLADGSQQRLHHTTGEVLGSYSPNDGRSAYRHFRKQRDDQLTLIPGAIDRVRIVHQIYRRYFLDDWGIRRIAEELNITGVPSPTGRTWSFISVRNILNNATYTGQGIANRETSALYYKRAPKMPAPVEPGRRLANGRPAGVMRPSEEWLTIAYPHLIEFLPQDVRAMALAHHANALAGLGKGRARVPRDRHLNSAYLLKGLLRTTEGLKMTGRTKGKHNQKRYYQVSTAFTNPTADDHLRRLVDAGSVERYVLAEVKKLFLQLPNLRAEAIAAAKDHFARKSEAVLDRGQLERDRSLVNRRIAMLADDVDGANDEAIQQKLAALKSQRNHINQQLAACGPTVVVTDSQVENMIDAMLSEFQESAAAFDGLPSKDMRELLAAVIEELVVDLKTMQFRCVLRLPGWAAPSASSSGSTMGLGPTSVYRGTPHAHLFSAARREFEFVLRRKAA